MDLNLKLKKLTALLLCLFMLCGCNVQQKKSSKLSIMTTLFPQYDFARQVSGDKADTALLLPPGVEAHAYEPTAADIIKISECDIFIYTGDSMEPWAKKLIGSGEIRGTVINLTEGVTLDNESDGDPDPHVWTDPQYADEMVRKIADALCSADPDNAAEYKENADNYRNKIKKLDGDFKACVDAAPHKEMVFGTKFSLHYFAKRYGISHLAAFDSCGEETEPSVKVMTELIEVIKVNSLKYVWYGELESTKTADAIAEETGASTLKFHSCHNVTKSEFDAGETYVSLMTKNLDALRKGLY